MKENWSEIFETPPISSRDESELETETPLSCLPHVRLYLAEKRRVLQAKIDDIYTARFCAKQALGILKGQVNIGRCNLRPFFNLQKSNDAEGTAIDLQLCLPFFCAGTSHNVFQ